MVSAIRTSSEGAPWEARAHPRRNVGTTKRRPTATRRDRGARVWCRNVPGERASNSSTLQCTLWTERGFEQGVEETTVEEIVQAAGVTKGTFYFHFAHKEDILLEVGWGTSEALFKDATKALAADRSVDDVLDELLVLLARRISATPRAAVARTLAEFYRRPDQGRELAGEHFGFQRSFAVVFFHAQETGQLPVVHRRAATSARCSRR